MISSRETERGRRVTRLTHTGNINVDRMILCELWIIAAIAITRIFFMNRITPEQYKDIKSHITWIDIHSPIYFWKHEKYFIMKNYTWNTLSIKRNYWKLCISHMCNCYVIKTVQHSNMYEIIKITTHVKS